ncbi:hypothetical protein GCM10009821_15960 [Aeromicrobium halocynthiae]|uniref:VanZ-like domain-containing protein n=1 Tax=Aeromicrobium halocynthiae TaxID=560557 RepID=A0ABN2VYM6_9ACTN
MPPQPVVVRHETPPIIRTLDIGAKVGLLLLLALAITHPDLGNMRDKAAGLRAVAYPLLSFTIPIVWFLFWRHRSSFPWLADLFVTITCFTDILGNRMDLYDTIVWFDDWMHFMNTGLLTAAFVLLTLPRTATFGATLERSLSFGVTAALAWEIAEYYAFLSSHSERTGAYRDTLGDMGLGALGAVVAAVVIHAMWQRGRLLHTAPQLESRERPLEPTG